MISPMEVVGSTEEIRIFPMKRAVAHDQQLQIRNHTLPFADPENDEVIGLIHRQNLAVNPG